MLVDTIYLKLQQTNLVFKYFHEAIDQAVRNSNYANNGAWVQYPTGKGMVSWA